VRHGPPPGTVTSAASTIEEPFFSILVPIGKMPLCWDIL